ncbi:MAG: GNAT family N-acyltransferase [bacterium]|nr:GNAT family N-acyltransferase [bacterium]
MNQFSDPRPKRLFRLPITQGTGFKAALLRQLTPLVEKATGLSEMGRQYYEEFEREGGEDFFEQVLKHLKVDIEVSDADLDRIPAEGPLLVMANHPFGALEGMALAQVIARKRPDLRLLVNHFLGHLPDTSERCFYVDPYGGPEAARGNLRALKQSMDWVKGGGVLGLFPSGEVAQMDWVSGRLTEAPWQANLARLVRKTGAQVLLVHFEGRNSLWFQLAAAINARLKTALLARELLNKLEFKLKLQLGSPLEPTKLERYPEDQALMDYLRQRCLLLGHRASPKGRLAPNQPAEPLAEAQNPADLQAEVSALGPAALLSEKAPVQVICAQAQQIPKVLAEIGRLRELSFRAVGEGTGKARDLDLFDEYYHHLFLWDQEAQQVLGAYRIGLGQEIYRRFRKKGFYLSSLFTMRSQLLQHLSPGLELGRSFVRPEAQKSFLPLMLLWKGIGAFVAGHPECRFLFGPVSISADYNARSRSLMMAFLKDRLWDADLAKGAKPRRPLKLNLNPDERALLQGVEDFDQLGELVLELEQGQRGVPILLKQYLKLGGKILGFNLDPDFSDVADAFLVVDLLKTPQKQLQKYMGQEAAQRFLAHWAKESPEP